MKIVFIGTQEIGLICLKELIRLNQEIALVITTETDDKVKNFVKLEKFNFLTCKDINNQEIEQKIKEIKPDIMVVCGWNKLIKERIYSIPVKKTVALHASLLPKNRGFAPMIWPIINNEKETGVTLFYINEEMDKGDIIGQIKFEITAEDTGFDLYQKASGIVGELIKKYIPMIENDVAPRLVQKESDATYAFARIPEDGIIDWSKSAFDINNFVRAQARPFSGAFTYCKNEKLYILKAHILTEKINFFGNYGQIVKIIPGVSVWVLTGSGILVVELVESDGDQFNASQFFKSVKLTLGFNIVQELMELRTLLKKNKIQNEKKI
jgi:methionyl-tRNA formyltransferase